MTDADRCAFAHARIVAGGCPFCHERIVRDPRGPAWDVAALLADIDSGDEGVRRLVFRLAREHVRDLDASLCLFRRGMASDESNVALLAFTAAQIFGAALSPDDADRLERRIDADPGDLAARAAMLAHLTMRQYRDPSAKPRRLAHVLRVVEEIPGSIVAGNPFATVSREDEPEAYERAKATWLRHVEANHENVAILNNAATFFVHKERDAAIDLTRRCKALEPGNAEWPRKLAHLLELERHGADDDKRRSLSREALAEREEAIALDVDNRSTYLGELAEIAFDAGEHDSARRYAAEGVADASWPDAVHKGETVLGRLDLLAGDVRSAKEHLLASVRAEASPVMKSYGPRWALARELLECGERAAVLDYMRLVATFWQPHDQRLDRWVYEVERGATPDFGPW